MKQLFRSGLFSVLAVFTVTLSASAVAGSTLVNAHGNGSALRPADGAGYTQVSAGVGAACGVQIGGAITCWGGTDGGITNVPAGTYTEVSTGGSFGNTAYACGLRTDQTLTCWGRLFTGSSNGSLNPPAGLYTFVDAGIGTACALKTSGAAVCWGGHIGGSAPAGAYSELAVSGQSFACGLQTSGSVVCWGSGIQKTDVPSGTFTQISAGQGFDCGIKTAVR